MASYTGGAREETRIRALAQERATVRKEIERAKGAISSAAGGAGAASRNFAAHKDTVEDLLKSDTVGLVTHRDFKARREYLEKCAADEMEKRKSETRLREVESQRLQLRKANAAKLSFGGDDDDDDDSDESGDESADDNDVAHASLPDKRKRAYVAANSTKREVGNEGKAGAKGEGDGSVAASAGDSGDGGDGGGRDILSGNDDREDFGDAAPAFRPAMLKRPRLTKNPDANTDFLPDRDRELAEEAERERLKQEWINEQERIKNELVNITYSYWDGAGHRRVIRCKKGTTVGRFLSIVQTQFKELRNVSADEMLFIKEDLIIPHHYSFYDFIVSKARGKSGPLFNFDVVEDVRLVSDANKEKQDAHAAKVVERRWYERNRHIFPASRWTTFDPKKKYGEYTIHGQ